MRLSTILFREAIERRAELVAAFLCVAAGAALVVATSAVSTAWRDSIQTQVHELGANMLVLPAEATVADYYTADLNGGEIPESYVARLATSTMNDQLHAIVPLLTAHVRVYHAEVLLTGVLPQNEVLHGSTWEAANDFAHGLADSRNAAAARSGARAAAPTPPIAAAPHSAHVVHSRVDIDNLSRDEVLLGSDLASAFGRPRPGTLDVLGQTLRVAGVREPTGTIDDSRIYVHLHTVQRLLHTGHVVNAMALTGCGCHLDLVKLGRKIEKLLPGTRVHTIRSIAETQWNTVKLLTHAAAGLVMLVAGLAAAAIINALAANVRERERELASLAAIGARPQTCSALVLTKSALVGAAGGVAGAVTGAGMAGAVGARWIGQAVSAPSWMLLVTVAACTLFSAVAGLVPAAAASHVDPARAFQEI